jgi:hypothetical protein
MADIFSAFSFEKTGNVQTKLNVGGGATTDTTIKTESATVGGVPVKVELELRNYGDTPFIFSSVRLGIANFACLSLAKLDQHFSRHFS